MEGLLHRPEYSSGRAVSYIGLGRINGNQVIAQALTKVKGDLEEGRTVKVTGVISEGILIARNIEVSRQPIANCAPDIA